MGYFPVPLPEDKLVQMQNDFRHNAQNVTDPRHFRWVCQKFCLINNFINNMKVTPRMSPELRVQAVARNMKRTYHSKDSQIGQKQVGTLVSNQTPACGQKRKNPDVMTVRL
jgi:hypothetical protein